MNSKILKNKGLLPHLALYFLVSGCGDTGGGCTTYSISTNIKQSHKVDTTDSSGNVDKATLPIKLTLNVASDQSPTGITISGGLGPAIQKDITVDFSSDGVQEITFDANEALFMAEGLNVKDSSGNSVLTRTGSPRVNILGWSSVGSVLFLGSGDAFAVEAVDLSSSPATSLEFESTPQVYTDGRIFFPHTGNQEYVPSTPTTPSSYVFNYSAKHYSPDFKIRETYSVTMKSTYETNSNVTHNIFSLAVVDQSGKTQSPTEFTRDGYKSINRCMSEDGRKLQISDNLLYDLDQNAFVEQSISCGKGDSFQKTHPENLFTAEVQSSRSNWKGAINLRATKHDLEKNSYDWKCDAKTFTIGELELEYSLVLASEAGDEIKQSGKITAKLGDPTCESHYSGG